MITLYGDVTPNTQKITITLAELGLDYKKVKIDRAQNQQMTDWFLKLAPNNKFPVITDDSQNLTIWESGAILIYLCDQYDQTGQILSRSGPTRYEVLQGTFFQAANIGPNLGRLNSQLTATDDNKIPGMIDLFYEEAVRLSVVLDRMFSDDRDYIAGDYSIADIMHYPWLKAGLDLGFPAIIDKPRLTSWLNRISERPAVQLGMGIEF